MEYKWLSIQNDDKQNHPFCRLKSLDTGHLYTPIKIKIPKVIKTTIERREWVYKALCNVKIYVL